jgi:hypothetical protein
MIKVLHPYLHLLASAAIATSLIGCKAPKITDTVPGIARDFKPHMQQVLDNIAAFSKDPGTWPSHVLIFKGAFETRQQWIGAVGTSTKLENTTYGVTRWEFSVLDDPYDIQRVRLLYQWQVAFITFDELEKAWNEIRDRPVLDGAGKPVMGSDGRPTFLPLALPVTRNFRRDWTSDGMFGSSGRMTGTTGLSMPGIPAKTISVNDTECAAEFSLAVLTAMVNTRVKARWGDATMPVP